MVKDWDERLLFFWYYSCTIGKSTQFLGRVFPRFSKKRALVFFCECVLSIPAFFFLKGGYIFKKYIVPVFDDTTERGVFTVAWHLSGFSSVKALGYIMIPYGFWLERAAYRRKMPRRRELFKKRKKKGRAMGPGGRTTFYNKNNKKKVL